MPINPADVRKLREFTVLGSQSERLDNLLEEREGLLERNRENNTRIAAIDGEVIGVENRFRSIANGIRAVLNKIDPPGQGGGPP